MKLDPITRANRPKRMEVLMGEDAAAALINDGDVVIVWGLRGTVNHPMPIVRALIRRNVKNLTVIGAATAGLELDMLIGAGCVKKVIAPYVGAELHAPVGNCFRYAAENGTVEVYETTEYLLYSQLDAAARGLGFMPWRGGVGTSLLVLNPDYVLFQRSDQRRTLSRRACALHADWAIIHVGQADIYGNGQHGGARFGDRLLSRAAERVMLTAERIVPNSEIRKNPFKTSVAFADVVVEGPLWLAPLRQPAMASMSRTKRASRNTSTPRLPTVSATSPPGIPTSNAGSPAFRITRTIYRSSMQAGSPNW